MTIQLLWDPETLRCMAHQQGWVIHPSETIDSTNTFLLQLSRQHSIHRHWAITRVQENGKGRRGRQWHTQSNEALLMSFGWTFDRPLSWVAKGSSLVVGHSVAQAIITAMSHLKETSYLGTLRLKWPNDVILNTKKLAGILIETAQHTHNQTTIVIGIGLNWKTPCASLLPHSIGLETLIPQDQYYNAIPLLKCLLDQLDKDLHYFGEDGFAPFRYDWNLHHVWPQGTAVCWHDLSGLQLGIIEHVDAFGQLWVIDQSGSRLALGHEAYSLRLRKEEA